MGQGYWTKRNGQLALAGIKFWRADWALLIDYVAGDGVHDTTTGNAYICTLEHQASATDQPGVGVNWHLYWDVLVDGGNGTVYIDVTQNAHGFSVGDYVRPDPMVPGSYLLAQADNFNNATGVGFVTNIIDVNSFKLVQTGYVKSSESPGAVPVQPAGTVLWLDPAVAGGYTTTAPSSVGQFIKPIAIITESATSMWVFSDFALEVQSVVTTDEKVKVSITDTVAGFLDQKITLVAGTNVTITKVIINPGANEVIQYTINASGGGGSSPLTTKGDIFTYTTVNARLPVGLDGFLLSSDSTQATGLKWIRNIFGNGAGGIKIGIDNTSHTIFTNGSTTAYTMPIPAGTLGIDDAIRFTIPASLFDIHDGADLSVSVTYGTTLLATALIHNATVSTLNGNGALIQGFVAATGSLTAQKGTIAFVGGAGLSPNGAGVAGDTGTATEDSTLIQNLVIKVIVNDGTGNTGIKVDQLVVEKIATAARGVIAPFAFGDTIAQGDYVFEANGGETLYQNYPSSGSNMAFSNSSSKWFGGSFTCDIRSAIVSSVSMLLGRDGGGGVMAGTLTVNLYDLIAGVPSGAALFTSNVDVAAITISPSKHTFTFPGTVTLVPGNLYAIVVDTTNISNFNGNHINFYVSTSTGNTGFTSSDGGATWLNIGQHIALSVFQPLTLGKVYRVDETTNTDTTLSNAGPYKGFALASGVDGDVRNVQLEGIVSGFSFTDAGQVYIDNTVLGGITQTLSGRSIGVAISTQDIQMGIMKSFAAAINMGANTPVPSDGFLIVLFQQSGGGGGAGGGIYLSTDNFATDPGFNYISSTSGGSGAGGEIIPSYLTIPVTRGSAWQLGGSQGATVTFIRSING